ncbi:MAG: GerMN domain-containing protein [Patescibacteria group bacterium]
MANNTPSLPIRPSPNQNQNRNQSQGQNQNKGNFWLILIIILVIIAVLWPILRRNPSTDANLPDESGEATTTIPTDEAADAASATNSIDNTVEVSPETVKPVAAVTLALPEEQTLRIYFSNQKFDPSGQKCETVYPVFRTVPRTTAVARAALMELLKGPTAAEAANGATTSLKPEVKLQNLTIANTIARADFSREFELSAADDCQASAQRAQIVETLKQFPTVKSVVISVNGVLD